MMKKIQFSIVVVLSCLAVFAAPRKVVMVVQNHCSGKITPPMSALADTLVAELAGERFTVINPENVIGVNQNRTASGEKTPEVSARELARLENADGVITASLQEFTGDSIGVPVVAYAVKARLSLSLMDASTGETICGVNNVSYSRNVTAEMMKEDNVSMFETQLHAAASKASAQFLAKAAKCDWTPKIINNVKVFLGCNVLGADVQIDGLAYGTCPAEIEVTPGIHTLEVSYSAVTNSWYHPYRRTARFVKDGQTFSVVLQLTSEGTEERQKALASEADLSKRHEVFAHQMKLADAMLERYTKSGEADDYVRKTIADGTSLYWKNSFGRIVITDGKAEKIDFAMPSTDTGDIVYPPDATEISDGLGNLLKTGRK